MAKMLDALARAQRERAQSMEATTSVESSSGPQPVAGPSAVAQGSPSNSSASYETARMEPVIVESLVESRPANFPKFSEQPTVHPTIDDRVLAAHDGASPIVEQVRQIRTNLESVLSEIPARVVVVSSPVSGDGKTLFSANLAWVLADNSEQRAILIDADMRKPEQNRLYGVRRSPGLSEFLREQCTLDEAIHPTSLSNLSIMPAGRMPQRPTSLLSMHRLPELIEALKKRYTWILFDTPPLLPVTDAALIARLSVGLILVVRMGQTHRKVIERAQELLAEMRLPVLGCVLNEFAPERTTDHHYSRYYAYGRKDDDNS